MQSPPLHHYQDEEHLRLLSLFHRILGFIGVVVACCPGIYVFFGIMIVTHPFPPTKNGPPPLVFDPVGWVFIAFGGGLVLLGWAFAVCLFVVATQFERRRGYGFCFAIACIECLFQPVGTALGVFTLVVLTRPSVKALFDRRFAAPASQPPEEGGAQPEEGGAQPGSRAE